MSTRRWLLGAVVALTLMIPLGAPAPASAQGITRFVNRTDLTCGGHSPCSTTIQAAVTAALAGDTILIQAGTYTEQVSIQRKNDTPGATELDRIVLEADPLAPLGSVVLQPPVLGCTNGQAIHLQRSKFITIRGLTIRGAGGPGILLAGGNNQNQAIHLERNRIFGNVTEGGDSCPGGITIASGNPDTVIANNLIYANGRNGIATINPSGGPHYVVGNTIHANAWNGVSVTSSHAVFLVNNAITGNGTAVDTVGGRFGVTRAAATPPDPAGIHLLNNLVCGNRLGEIDGPALDGTDSGNLTTTGGEGPGVRASPGCEVAANVYANVAGADGVPNTADDDFTLALGSPAIDHGTDPRTLGLATSFNALFEADYTGEAARPKVGTPSGPALFDMGALEFVLPDTQAPTVTFLQPASNAYVRQTVTVEAQATDSGTGVATFGLSVDGQSLSATLTPPLPPPAASVRATASLNTTPLPDGTHTLGATATDQTGNSASATRVVIVDNTPPDTQITSGPSGEISQTSATFAFTGSDNLTAVANLQFAWRLDGGAFSAFSSSTTATLSGVTDGAHTFEVKTRDLAGNEDPTPASRSFTVRLGPSITAVDPTSGSIGTLVTITGTNFEPGTTTVTFNGLSAVVRTITATQITTTVPIGATTGVLVVTTSRGTASRTFTVETTGDFALTAAPTSVRAIAGDQTSVSIAAGGSGSFTSLVSLSGSTPPSGISAGFSPSNFVAPGSNAFVNFAVGSTVAPGTYSFTVTGQAQVDGRTVSRTAAFTLEVLAPDTPAVTGRVLTAEAMPQPIPGVTLTLGSAFVLTDAGGNFVLLAPPSGPNMLFVDGRTASTPGAQFPIVEVNVTVSGSGPSRVPFNIYLPKLDTANPINLPLDPAGFTTQGVTATTPRIPGLEVTIPQGTRIIGPDGNPVAQLVITPVPVDRSPMPFPPGVTAPLLFAINPGGAVPSQPLPITFPNVQNAPPGSKADLYFFDLAIGGWNTWGTGTVSLDGTQIVSDPGFGLPRLAWHFAALRVSLSDQLRSNEPGRAQGGEPVDLPTGRFFVRKTDIVLPGRMPLTIQRTYRSENPVVGLLGIGWTLDPYDTTLTTAGSSMSLVLPDQSTNLFAPSGAGQWTNTQQTFLRGAVLTQLPGDFRFQIRFKDGTLQRFERIPGFSNLAGLAAITDRNGNTVTLTRGTGLFDRRILQITEPAGRAFTLTYDASNRIASVTDPIGRVVQYAYDAQGRLDTVTDPAGGTTSYTYDANHRILTITDPRNITFLTNEYDTNGRVIRQTQADGGGWQFAYALEGTVVTQTTLTDPRGNPTTYRFNSQGFTLSTTDALGQTTSFDYAPGSNLLLATTDPLGRVTRFTYDGQGNVTTITDPAGNTRTFTYEPTFNKVASIRDPLGNLTQFAYDVKGNVTTVTDPILNRTTLTYNAFGQPLTTTDPLANTTTFTYDAQGNLASVADQLGSTATRQYDAASRLTRQTDPRGKPTVFAYDALNRIRAISDASGSATRFTYDGNGNLLTVTDPQGNVTTYTYETMDRVATRSDPLGRSESFTYDLAGNITGHTDRKGQVATFGYDTLNRRTGATYVDATVTYGYDAVGRLTRATDSAGGTIANAYDPLDRLRSQTTALGEVGYTYDVLGRRTAMTVPGQAPVSYAYDAASRLTSITQGDSLSQFAYDAASRRTTLTLPNGVTTQYGYDTASRLTSLTYRLAATVLGDLRYTYDAAGNRVAVGGSWARTGLPQPVASATYNANNQQLTFGGQPLTYDLNGNLTGDGTSTYTWTARNQLATISGPVPASFVYDGVGRRMRKTVNTMITDFLYDGVNPIQEVSGALATSLLTGLGVDENFLRGEAGGASAFLTDALGSTVALTDPAGVVQTQYTYEPFGQATTTGAVSPNPFQYTGRENDATGLYYYRARYYHPGLRRFISEDPLEFDGGDANLYAYVFNRPTNYVDPLGTAIAADSPLAAACGPLPLGTRTEEKLLRGIECALMITPMPAAISSGAMAGQSAKALARQSLRRVGDILESVDDIVANAELLRGLTPADVVARLGRLPARWTVDTLGRGSHAGQGWVLREVNTAGNLTGRVIFWHPGAGHHGVGAYWKVSSSQGGIVRVFK
jgi:RHS repeat-associated protein